MESVRKIKQLILEILMQFENILSHETANNSEKRLNLLTIDIIKKA